MAHFTRYILTLLRNHAWMAIGHCHSCNSNCTLKSYGTPTDQVESFFLDLRLKPTIRKKLIKNAEEQSIC